MHDLWEENCLPGNDNLKLAHQWEKAILTGARRVLCMTSVQADFYREKYGIESQLLPHTILPSVLANAPASMTPPTLPDPTVLCVGTLSWPMNTDAMGVFAKAAELLPSNIQCLILSRSDPAAWAAAGAANPRIAIRSASRAEVAQLVSASHILLAPLSHKNCTRDEVRTVLSTKLLEYFVSGRPILVFSPEESFHARSAREGDWGYVVDKDDPRAMADGIMKLLGDESLCARLVAGALDEAKRRNAAVYAKQLYEWTMEDAGLGLRRKGTE
jgi:glycosyltransferase involved in cell wall biosynthesis